MRVPFSINQLAQAAATAVWNFVALGSRTVTTSTNSDKTNYTLSSTSRGTIKTRVAGIAVISASNATNTFSLGITVVMVNCLLRFLGFSTDTNSVVMSPYIELLDTQNVRCTRSVTTNTTTVSFELTEMNG